MELYEEITLLIFLKLRPQIWSKFDIYYMNNQQNKDIIEGCPSIKKGRFFPTFYLSLGLLQAIFGSKSKHKDSCIKFKKQYISFQDYGEFGVDWAYSEEKNEERVIKEKKMICIFPGLVSSINEPYIVNIIAKCYNHGYKVCLLNDRFYTNRDNGRGISFPKNTTFTFVEDYKRILEVIKKEHPDYTFYAIGHSFGANTLTKYVGLYAQENIFSGVVCASNPWDFHLGARFLTKQMDSFLVSTRMKILLSNKHVFDHQKPAHLNYDYNEIIKSKNCRQLDNQFTSVCLGYRNADEYYRSISSVNEIDRIKIPALFLQSKDDPILSEKTLPKDEVLLNPNLIMIATNTGGHVGWFEGFAKPRRWYMKPALEFIEYIDSINSKKQN